MLEQCVNVNINILKIDAIKQYGRREKVRIHGMLEKQHEKEDNGESAVLKTAKTVKFDLNSAVFNERRDC